VPDKLSARRRATFLRASLCRGRRRRNPSPSGLAQVAGPQLAASLAEPTTKHASEEPNPGASVTQVTSLDKLTVYAPGGIRIIPKVKFAPASTSVDHWKKWPAPSRMENGIVRSVYQREVDHGPQQPSRLETEGYRDSTVLEPSFKHEVRTILKRASHSSSFFSDLFTFIDWRSSLSSDYTTIRYSVAAFSESGQDDCSSETKASKILERQRAANLESDKAQYRRCCALQNCVHRFIDRLIKSDPFLWSLDDWETQALLDSYTSELVKIGSTPAEALFYAARVGAPVDIIFGLLHRNHNLNVVDAAGQTFLFSLDSTFFQGCSCTCSSPSPHVSKFECLMLELERRHFPLDHLDHHGRHFLSYLCTSPRFDLQWLTDMITRYDGWERRLARVSQLRDSSGMFLADFVALHPDYKLLDDDMLARLKPHFRVSGLPIMPSVDADGPNTLHPLHNEDDFGRSALHAYMQRPTWPLHEPFFPVDASGFDVNKYDCQGRTPIMSFLEKAFELDMPEEALCKRLEQLIKLGGNVNACSRGGSTALHFAAKKALPKLLDTLFAHDVTINHRDEMGMSALDHAALMVKYSRSARRPAELLARSIRSAAKLLSKRSSSSDISTTESAPINSATDDTDIRQLVLDKLGARAALHNVAVAQHEQFVGYTS
jgi:hypothetical protein